MSDGSKEITPKANTISVLAAKSAGKEITPSQGDLALGLAVRARLLEQGKG